MLISLSGLPGAGKTTIARELARQIGAIHLHVDAIEQAIRESGMVSSRTADDGGSHRAAYRIAQAVADENLRLGRFVLADCVNPLPLSRDAWLEVAKAAGVGALEVEIVCSDASELRKRIDAGGTPRGDGGTPRSEQVARTYQPWERDRLLIDTAGEEIAASVSLLWAAVVTR